MSIEEEILKELRRSNDLQQAAINYGRISRWNERTAAADARNGTRCTVSPFGTHDFGIDCERCYYCKQPYARVPTSEF